ncbi:hypothetical protein FRC12_019342 [Ceratobasidium sp. 428]|nr:hypothetical protein FRC12_019342 [Ceratobasidium sp. 428]
MSLSSAAQRVSVNLRLADPLHASATHPTSGADGNSISPPTPISGSAEDTKGNKSNAVQSAADHSADGGLEHDDEASDEFGRWQTALDVAEGNNDDEAQP